MILAGNFAGAAEVAEQNCSEWLLAGSGEVFHAEELREVAKEFDAKIPLAEDEFLAVTDDGSIGLLFPNLKEPEMYFVSPEWAVVNILKDDPRKYIIPDDGAQTMGGAGVAVGAGIAMGNAASDMTNRTAGYAGGNAQNIAAQPAHTFCTNCGAEIKAGSKFCSNCGAKNAPEFCTNCGAKLEPGSVFCGNCGTKV